MSTQDTNAQPANSDTVAATQAFAIALEGERDPRRDPERGGRLDALLNGLSDERLDAIRLACQELEVAATCAQLRNYGFKPMSVA